MNDISKTAKSIKADDRVNLSVLPESRKEYIDFRSDKEKHMETKKDKKNGIYKIKKPSRFKEYALDRQQKKEEKLRKLEEKHKMLQTKLSTKAQTQRLKTDIAELKQRQRNARILKFKGFTSKTKEHVYIHEPARERLERAKYKQEQEHKYKPRHSEDGELPHYVPEHMRKLKRTSHKVVKKLKVKSTKLI